MIYHHVRLGYRDHDPSIGACLADLSLHYLPRLGRELRCTATPRRDAAVTARGAAVRAAMCRARMQST